jgi:hypothetical protein
LAAISLYLRGVKILGRAGLFAALSLLTLLFFAPPALAQGKADVPAKALQKKAMDEDYLSLEFDKAAEKLTKAIAMCGADKCAPLLRAQLRRDLGVVQIGSGADKDKGAANFIEALKIEATLALDPDIKTKELEAQLPQPRPLEPHPPETSRIRPSQVRRCARPFRSSSSTPAPRCSPRSSPATRASA